MIYSFLCLIFLLSGCYTIISDPLRIKEIPAADIHQIDKLYDNEEVLPIVRKSSNPYYGNYTNPYYGNYTNPYYGNFNGYYYNRYGYSSYRAPIYYSSYLSEPPQNIDTSQSVQKSTSVAPPKPPVDKERAKAVWQKRIDSRLRKAPTPTPKKSP